MSVISRLLVKKKRLPFRLLLRRAVRVLLCIAFGWTTQAGSPSSAPTAIVSASPRDDVQLAIVHRGWGWGWQRELFIIVLSFRQSIGVSSPSVLLVIVHRGVGCGGGSGSYLSSSCPSDSPPVYRLLQPIHSFIHQRVILESLLPILHPSRPTARV